MKLSFKAKPKVSSVPTKKATLPTSMKSLSQASGKNVPGWMMTSQADKRAALKEQELNSGRRPPELWVMEDEDKLVRFRQPEELCCLYVYKVPRGGTRFDTYTAPERGEVDLFEEAGLKRTFQAVYEVIDIKGYTEKKTGKKKRNVARFYRVGARGYQQLQKLLNKRGPLCDYNIEISRSGTGTNTTYAYIPQEHSPMTPEMKAAEKLSAKLADYYRPPTEEEQRVILKNMVPQDND